MLVGLGTAAYTGYRGYQATSESGKYASLSGNAGGGQASASVRDLLQSLRDERGLTGEVLGDPTASTNRLQDQWAKTDRAAAAVRASADPIVSAAAVEGLVALRTKIVSRQIPLLDAVDAYSSVIVDAESRRSTSLSEVVPDTRVVRQDEINTKLSDLTETLEVSDALAFSAFSDQGMPSDVLEEYSQATGDLQALLTSLQRSLPPDEAGELNRLTTGPDGEVVAVVQRAILHGGELRSPADAQAGGRQDAGTTQEGGSGRTDRAARREQTQPPAVPGLRVEDTSLHVDLPVPRPEWRSSTSQMSSGLVTLQSRHLSYAAGIARDVGRQQLMNALLGSIALFVFAIIVLVISLGVSRSLIGRLRRLRQETIELSHSRLPALVGRLRDGEQVDVHQELPPLDFGSDEIGQVAEAFGEAQRTAVAAAAKEAETRSGLRKVFLDIAHRSQAIVYRQLKVLDQAERGQEDPDQLELLFQLDHLATRARRHAENLIILAGGQAGRQWRDPVVLLQLIRSSISEAENYTRVSVTGVPDVTVLGAAVADLIHLLAELVDNATSFSPPASIVEMRGNLVGRGLVIEIEDQGLGVDPSQLGRFNEMLHNPPDFQMMALAEEPRLGLFVVARLAARHGIRVTLTASPAYGGTKVVVLIPATLFVAGSQPVEGTQPVAARGSGDTPTRALQALPTEGPAEPSRPELVRPEPRLEAVRPEPSRPEPSRPVAEPFRPEPLRSEPLRPEPLRPEPSRPEPLRPVVEPLRPAARTSPTPSPLGGPREQVPVGPRQRSPLPSRTSPSPEPVTRSARPPRALLGDDRPYAEQSGRATYEAAQRPAPRHQEAPGIVPAPPAAPFPPSLGGPSLGGPSLGGPSLSGPSLSGPSSGGPPAGPPAATGGGGDRPDLPRRVRQSHMSPKLRQERAVPPDAGPRAPAPVDAETARSRMSALQRGTMRGRATEPGEPR